MSGIAVLGHEPEQKPDGTQPGLFQGLYSVAAIYASLLLFISTIQSRRGCSYRQAQVTRGYRPVIVLHQLERRPVWRDM